jgi:hypothetical protein
VARGAQTAAKATSTPVKVTPKATSTPVKKVPAQATRAGAR